MIFTNWRMPDEAEIRLEHRLEYVGKALSRMCGGAFDKVEDFIKAVRCAKVMDLTPAADRSVAYRSHTETFDQLLGLLKTYRSWGTFRTESSLKGLYEAFRENKSMSYPMVLQFCDGDRRVFCGNTRLDVAFQLGMVPRILMVEVHS